MFNRLVKPALKCLCASLLALPLAHLALGSDILLPDLGDAGNGLISPAQEYELGQKWLRIYRSQVYTDNDPFLQDYLEKMVRKLAIHSELKDKRLDILVINNPTLNAFAVPGGIIGVHSGLFKYAQNEQQFSSVIAHELAHLSQRHFARKLSEQQENYLPTMAALLASILIAATAGGEAGMAAISATQAAAAGAQLRFSRQMEQEADRVGMETLVKANMDPFSMPGMFEQMQKASRFQRKPPEFLLTHPLPQSRISDSYLRAQQYRKKQYPLSPDFQLAKVRALVSLETNASSAIKRFENEILGNTFTQVAAKYGLALAYLRAAKAEEAKSIIQELIKEKPDHLYFQIAMAEVLAEEKKFQESITLLDRLHKEYPRNHPLNIRFAEILMRAGQYEHCEKLLVQHSQLRPKDDYVWYLLAEVHGLTGDIYQVHTARAEYFLLNGLFEKAEIQLRNALKMVKEDKFLTAKLEQRLKTVKRLHKEMFER